MNRVSEDHVSFWRWCSLADSPVFTTIRLGSHIEITITQHEGDPATTVETATRGDCDDCDPDGCSNGCSMNLTGTLSISSGGATEEGSSWGTERYEFDGDTLTRMTDTSGRDCDGRVDFHYEDYAETLDGHVPHYHSDEPNPGITCPTWIKLKATQRDYTAEAAGY